eukprot:m.233393 g.233393  ORF g.233393 m.233393 type:complete len:404 (-) comp33640_c5_seq1:165-1376(-)
MGSFGNSACNSRELYCSNGHIFVTHFTGVLVILINLALIDMTFGQSFVPPHCDLGGSGKWVFNPNISKPRNMFFYSGEKEKSYLCYGTAARNKDALMRWEYQYTNNCRLLKTIPNISHTMWVGDSLLGQMFTEWVNIAANTLIKYRYVHAPVLVNGYTLRPMNASEWDTCRTTRQPHENWTNDTFTCPPYASEKVLSRTGFPYVSTMEAMSWAKKFEAWPGRHLKDSVLVINTGHHWWKENGMLSDIPGCRSATKVPWQAMKRFGHECSAVHKYSYMVTNVVRYLQSQGFKGIILYVTSPPGYPNCHNATVNVNPVLQSSVATKFHWDLPMTFDPLWRQAFRKTNLRYRIVNITNPSLLRGDAHPPGDCLHFCPQTVQSFWVESAMTELHRQRALELNYGSST